MKVGAYYMKCNVYIGTNHEEEINIYSKEKTALVDEIVKIAKSDANEIIAINENKEKFIVNPIDITCFITFNNKTYVVINNKKYQVKNRLYQYEEMLQDSFVKLNQSCLGNKHKVKCFKASIGGSLLVVFKDGYSDYISRRELKNFKIRMGL